MDIEGLDAQVADSKQIGMSSESSI